MPDSIVIGAALAQRAGYGGHAWALLQYVLGFRELGFDVTVVDRLEPGMIRWTSRRALGYLRRSARAARASPTASSARRDSRSAGSAARRRSRATAEARFLLNVMGFVRDPELLAAARRRVFLDIDPGFGQVWKELGLADVFAGHDDFVTVGRNVGERRLRRARPAGSAG